MGLFKSKQNQKSLHTVSPDRLLLREDTNFNIKEAYKAARTNVMFSVPGEGCKKVVITSSYPAEGKTTASTNLSITFAQTGNRVLLIDCDMRKPKIHKAFNLVGDKGLSNVLGGFCGLSEVMQKTAYENLSVISAGHIPPNPAELLASESMKKLLEELSSQFDYIFLDTPPVNVVTDATVLVPVTSGIIMVVRQAVTNQHDIQEALAKLELVEAKVLGFILGSIKPQKGMTGKYGKYGKYGAGYGKYGDYYVQD